MTEGALERVSVVDLSQGVAGPYCTKLLADYGADVVKVEPPGLGDKARHEGPFPGDVPDPEKSALFLYLNTNKRGVTLNLQSVQGREILKELVKEADILVENFHPQFMPSLGLDYETLEKINPKLVMTSITPFGQTGPYRDYKGDELVAQAMGGLMYITGDLDREPVKYGLTQAGYLAGTAGAAATLGALYFQRETELGQHVDVSAMEVLASMYYGIVVAYSYTGQVNVRGANDMYPCKDGYVIPAQGGTRTWQDYANFLGGPELQDPKFVSPADRIRHEAEMREIVTARLMEKTRMEWTLEGQAQGFPFGHLQTPEEILSCPHLAAREYFAEGDHPRAGKLTYPGAPFKLTGSPWQLRRTAPLLGEHNQEILCGRLGYSEGDLLRLRELGVI